MIAKKTRIKLRSIASTIKPTVWVGKDGFTDAVLKQISEELFNHELIKLALQETAPMLDEFELTEIAVKLGAEVVTVIGRKIVLFKQKLYYTVYNKLKEKLWKIKNKKLNQ